MKQNIVKGLGYKGTQLIANLKNKGKSVFTVNDALNAIGGSSHAVTNLLYNLVKRKKILRIERGKYLIIPPEAWKNGEYLEQGLLLAPCLASPYYLSFWTALNYYGYTEQPSRTIFVVTQKAKTSVSIKGIRYRFINLKPDKFFGYEEAWVDNEKVKMASREKTIVDCLDQPRYCGEIAEVAKGLWNGRREIDFKLLADYAERMKNRSIMKRLGFILETLNIKKPRIINKLRMNMSKGYSLLEPRGSRLGTYNNRWQLLVNVDPKPLTEWRKS